MPKMVEKSKLRCYLTKVRTWKRGVGGGEGQKVAPEFCRERSDGAGNLKQRLTVDNKLGIKQKGHWPRGLTGNTTIRGASEPSEPRPKLIRLRIRDG